MSNLFSLQGSVYSAVRNSTTGKPGKKTWLGNASSAELALSIDKSDKNETFSGARGLYGSLVKSKSGTLNLTLDEWLPENIALGLYTTPVDVTAGTVAAEAFPAALVAGDEVQLDNRFISSLIVTDSTGTPATLVAGTDYELVSASSAIVRILNVGSYTQPFSAAYSFADAKNMALFSNVVPPERWVMFDGINTVTGEKVVLDLFRCQFDPVTNFALINEDWGGLTLSAGLLVDSINLLDSNLGGYGRMITSAA